MKIGEEREREMEIGREGQRQNENTNLLDLRFLGLFDSDRIYIATSTYKTLQVYLCHKLLPVLVFFQLKDQDF